MDKEKLLQFLYEERLKLREDLNYARHEKLTPWANELKEKIGIYRHIIFKVESGQFDESMPKAPETTAIHSPEGTEAV